ncbi:uncharacterized protein BCR38DRAFT_161529 [Pseudomassariella vexata]|uniref:Uncharacterized protein n=1 Tax=Pseudomassariella vexata TaxID=1141098 RepID=A0A1Y2E7T5_9PEZI|nr:uncharacterized protein BCR38DRAFT_161529 [Pseudomassariella vexata]ORY67633.1 hypothetical protein BCR38DRAFT_161529 [Pseudomassariella vexata]
MAAEVQHAPRMDRLSIEDFETASIRSAAPSYVSEAPSYHSTIPQNEHAPAYTPRQTPNSTPRTSTPTISNSPASLLPTLPSVSTTSAFTPGAGLPRIPSPPRRLGISSSSSSSASIPQLSEFRNIPSWRSAHTNNPTARHYQNVAHRRATAASTSKSTAQVQGAMRAVLGRLTEDEERNRLRPLEDPYLVGEEAAARARRERLARENGDGILIREDRRWDWFLGEFLGPISTTPDSSGCYLAYVW